MPILFNESGLTTQNLQEILTELKNNFRSKFGNSFNLDDTSYQGKEIAIMAEALSYINEAILGVYNSNARSTASGISLSREVEDIGITKNPATKSTVITYVRGTSGASISPGALKVSVVNTNNNFENSDTVTLGSLGSKTATSLTQSSGTATLTISAGHSYPLNSYVFIRGADQSGYNILAQVKNPTGTTFDFTVDSGTVSPAVGTITVYEASPVNMQSVVAGSVSALSGTLTNIVGTVTGVNEVENAVDATLGEELETDAELRARADSSVSISGGGFREAILAKLRDVAGVTNQTVFANTDDVVDSSGRPPKSVECFVEGGTDNAVATAIFNVISDGIRTFGNTEVILQDSEGQNVTIQFSRLTTVEIYVDVTITTNTDPLQGAVYPADGDDQVAAALAAISYTAGFDVWETTLRAAVLSVDGVVSVASLTFDETASPSNTATVVILPTEAANVDSGNVNVTSS
jgi:uncharacterized phage protein gp47/JayE